MHISKLLSDPIFYLPTTYSDDFVAHCEYLLIDQYLDKLKSLKLTESEDIKSFTQSLDKIIERQEYFIRGLINTIEIYLDGHPHDAYSCFNSTLSYNGSEHPGTKWLFSTNKYFYRARREERISSLGEMFHIPFEKRGIVRNQRYSLSGVPSLYLSNNLYTCWKELQCPPIEELFFIRLNSINNLNFFNLTWNPNPNPGSFQTPYFYHRQLYHSLMRWPLIALCSVKVKNVFDYFKPEYIIPQILFQWIRNNSNFDGIVYESTHVDKYNTPQRGNFYNFVLHVRDKKKSGYCSYLCDSFQSSPVTSISNILKIENHFQDKHLKAFRDSGNNIEYSRHTIVENENGEYVPYSDILLNKIERYAFNYHEVNLNILL